MPNLVDELNQLNLESLMGGPLQAAIDANHAAAMSTVDYIKNVGFETTTSGGTTTESVRYVEFSVDKEVDNPDYDDTQPISSSNQPTIQKTVTYNIPFLKLAPPSQIGVKSVEIDFNAKLTSAQSRQMSSEFAASAELGVNYKIVKFKASASYKRKSSQGESVEKTYNLGVRILAERIENDDLEDFLAALGGNVEN